MRASVRFTALRVRYSWLRRRGDNQGALELATRSLALAEAIHGPAHVRVAWWLTMVARAHQRLGAFDQAVAVGEQALAVWRASGKDDDWRVAELTSVLASLAHRQGRLVTAESLYRETIALLRADQHDDPAILSVLMELSALYDQLGETGQAEATVLEALALLGWLYGRRRREYVTLLVSLAGLRARGGDHATADRLLAQANRAIRSRRAGDRPLAATLRYREAELHDQRGDTPTARRLYEEALPVLEQAGPDYAGEYGQCLLALAGVEGHAGEWRAAAAHYRAGLDLLTREYGDTHPALGAALHNLASLHRQRGEDEEAEALLWQALRAFQGADASTNIMRHTLMASSWEALARIEQAKGNLAEAAAMVRMAQDIVVATLGERHPHAAALLRQRAWIEAAQGESAIALSSMLQAFVAEHADGDPIRGYGSESDRSLGALLRRGRLDELLTLFLRQHQPDQAVVAAIYDHLLTARAAVDDATAAQRAVILGGVYPSLAPRLEELARLRRQRSTLRLHEGAGEEPATLQQLETLTRAIQGLEAQLALDIPPLAMAQRLRAVRHGDIASQLPLDSALIEYVRVEPFDFNSPPAHGELRWEPPRYLAFILTYTDRPSLTWVDLGLAGPIDNDLALFRGEQIGEVDGWRTERGLSGAYTKPRAFASTAAGGRLRRAIFDPLMDALGERSRLLLVTDGMLSWLPFEALPTVDGTYLIDRYAISHLASGRDLLRFGLIHDVTPSEPLVVAAPDFDAGLLRSSARSSDAARPDRFTALDGTREEGVRVAALLGVEPVLGRDATAERVRTCVSPVILHLATHGFFQPEFWSVDGMPAGEEDGEECDRLARPGPTDPMLRSGLAFAGANRWRARAAVEGSPRDGILFAADVLDMNLLGTRLVVLSACESGVGLVERGVGVHGLRRAFALAGAETLIMTVWKVGDEPARLLMERFYERVLAGDARVDALRAAQRTVRERYPRPADWAGFICYGDPSPLPEGRGSERVRLASP